MKAIKEILGYEESERRFKKKPAVEVTRGGVVLGDSMPASDTCFWNND